MDEIEDVSRAEDLLEVSIRRIREEDWKHYRTIRMKSLESDPAAFCTTLADVLGWEDSQWVERARENASSQNSSLWIAFLSNQPVGIVGIFMENSIFNLCHMWVDPAVRGKHLGRRLVETAIVWVRSVDHSAQIRLEVGTSQHEAIRLYTRCGFTPTGVNVNMKRAAEGEHRSCGVTRAKEMILHPRL